MKKDFLRQAVLVFLLTFPFFWGGGRVAFSQSSTLEIHKDKKTSTAQAVPEAVFNRVMIIPFDPKMYMSQCDKEISEKTGKDADGIRETFRKGICNNTFIEAKMVHNSVYKSLSMYSEDPEIIADQSFIYQSVGYKYLPVPARPDTAKTTAISSLQKASEKAQGIFEKGPETKKPAEEGTKINEGQIVSHPSAREKYMNTEITNPDALAYLSAKYECDIFIFINQMDLVVPPNTDYRDLASDDYSRLLKFHYTIVGKNGKEIYGDAAKAYFSSRENDAQSIVNGQFDDIAKEIVSHLPDPNQAKALQQKKNEEQKKAKQHKSSFDDF